MPHGITVLPATRQRWHSCPYPSRSWYSIKWPQSDARLSWPSVECWPSHSRLSDLRCCRDTDALEALCDYALYKSTFYLLTYLLTRTVVFCTSCLTPVMIRYALVANEMTYTPMAMKRNVLPQDKLGKGELLLRGHVHNSVHFFLFNLRIIWTNSEAIADTRWPQFSGANNSRTFIQKLRKNNLTTFSRLIPAMVSGPTAANLQQQSAADEWHRQTDRRTLYRYIDPAPLAMWPVSTTVHIFYALYSRVLHKYITILPFSWSQTNICAG